MLGLEQPDIVPTTFANESMQTSSGWGAGWGGGRKKKEINNRKIGLLLFHDFQLEQLEFLNQEALL